MRKGKGEILGYVSGPIAVQTHFFSVEEQDGSTRLRARAAGARFAVRALLAFGLL